MSRSLLGRLCSIALMGLLIGCATENPTALRRADTHRRLAELKLQQHQLEVAIREYQQALAIHEEDPEAHFGLSEAYRRKGFFKLAETHLRRTLEIDPANLEARLNLGVVYLHRGLFAKAILENDRLLRDPAFLRPERALVNRGWAHYRSGDLAAAAADFHAVLLSNPQNYHAQLNLGIVLFDQGEVLEAARAFEVVLDIVGERRAGVSRAMRVQTHFRLGQAHVKLGNRTKAVRYLRQAVKEGDRGEWGRKSKEYLAVLE